MTTQRYPSNGSSLAKQQGPSLSEASAVATTLSRELAPHYWVNAQMGRYYAARLLMNLFGQWELEQAWGSLSSRRGRLRYVPLESRSAGQAQLRVVARQRQQRGYVATEPAVVG